MCRKTREEFINQECEEAEKLEKINNAKFHSKVKSLTWPRKKVAHSLIDDNGTEIYDANDILTDGNNILNMIIEKTQVK